MPIYEYRCQQGHTFEVMQRMSDDPIVSCETCEAPVERVFHPIAVHFKGSGFYNTDYGTRRRSREKAESGAGENTGKDSGSSSESGSKDGGSSSESGSKDSGSKKSSAKAASSSVSD